MYHSPSACKVSGIVIDDDPAHDSAGLIVGVTGRSESHQQNELITGTLFMTIFYASVEAAAPMIRLRFSGAKNSGMDRAPLKVPKKRLICS